MIPRTENFLFLFHFSLFDPLFEDSSVLLHILMGNIMSTSFAPECTKAKQQYDDCFNDWYTESE